MKQRVVRAALDRLVSTAKYLADCGNTCSKLALNDESLAVAFVDDAELDAWFADKEAASLLILAGQEERATLLGEKAHTHGWSCTLLNDQLASLKCGQYASMGVDRLVAGIAAVNECQGDVISIDAGTMLTLSAWRFDTAADFNAQFHGGFIAPGPQACLDAMHQSAPALPALSFESKQGIGIDTPSHMIGAINHGWPAMAEALLAQLQKDLPDAAIMVTGGWSEYLPFTQTQTHHALVLRGVQLIDQKNN